MLKRYYVVGDKLLCFIPRTGTTSLLQLIEDKYYPQHKHPGVDIHFRTPSIIDDHKSELIAVIRDPIDRFLSGCARRDWTVEQGIEELQKPNVDIHIRPQYTFLSEHRKTKFFSFPHQLNECAEYLGLPTPIPHLNKMDVKPEMTAKQKVWLIDYYMKDFELLQ
jgi:hypothetical protein